jgi:hypothetical protein
MRGVYGHVSPAMRAELKAALQACWEGSLRDLAQLCPRSIVPTLDALLEPYRQAPVKIRSCQDPLVSSIYRDRTQDPLPTGSQNRT